jgi:hypothetical protein
MHGFKHKEADYLSSTFPIVKSPPSPPQWGQMLFAEFKAMVGSIVPLEGEKGGEAIWGDRSPFETSLQNHFIAFPLDVWLFQRLYLYRTLFQYFSLHYKILQITEFH